MEKSNKRTARDNEQQEKEMMPNLSKTESEDNYNVEVGVKSQVNVFHLNCDVWRIIMFQYLSENDVINLSAVCKQFQQIVQNTNNSYNLSKNYQLDVGCFLKYALSKSCTTIDINYCKWLTPNTINEMISKTNLHHLHLIQCQVNEDCVRSICNLPLQSFSFTYTKEWRSHFLQNSQKRLPFSQTLNRLKIEFSKTICSSLGLESKTPIFDIFTNFLQYCKEIQHLKLCDDNSDWARADEIAESTFPSQTTPLLKLKSLKIAIHPHICKKDVLNFLKALLQDKIIPLKNVDFGYHTIYLLNKGILSHPLIFLNKFILRQYLWRDVDIADDYYEYYQDKLSTCNWTSSVKSVFVEHLKIRNLATFVEKELSTSGTPLKKLYIRDCSIKDGSILVNFVKGIELFAINCPQLTALHFTIKERSLSVVPQFNYAQMMNNEAIIETLSNLKS